MTGKAIPFVIRRVRTFERLSRRRGQSLFDQGWFVRLLGLVIIVFTLAAVLAPPFSGLDTLPALGVVLIGMSIILARLRLHRGRRGDRRRWDRADRDARAGRRALVPELVLSVAMSFAPPIRHHWSDVERKETR